jgi:DNA-binding transcriptional MerR regulator
VILVSRKQLRKHGIDFRLEHVGVPLEEIREIVSDNIPHECIDRFVRRTVASAACEQNPFFISISVCDIIINLQG